jgi:phosphatidylglycerophosphate synthase
MALPPPTFLAFAARALTVLRLVATLPFAALLAAELAAPSAAGGGALAVLFAAIALSDFADGRLARAAGTASAAWGRVDVVADVLFNASSLAVAAAAGLVGPWLPAAVAVLGARHLWRTRPRGDGPAAPPDPLGRVAGIFFYVASGAVVAEAVLGLPGRSWIAALADALAIYAAIVLARAFLKTSR